MAVEKPKTRLVGVRGVFGFDDLPKIVLPEGYKLERLIFREDLIAIAEVLKPGGFKLECPLTREYRPTEDYGFVFKPLCPDE